MANVYKRLAATAVTANTNTLLYQTSTGKATVISSIFVCNTSTSTGTFRIAVCPGAIGSVAIQDYIYYDIPIYGNDTYCSTTGITMAANSTIMVRASSANTVFSVFGSEIS